MRNTVIIMGKAALYARVSTSKKKPGTDDFEQDPEVQLCVLRELAKKMGLEVYQEYSERVSGLNPNKPVLQQALMDGARNRFTHLLIFKMDRLTREGIKALFDLLEKFEKTYKITVISATEGYLSSNAPQVELVRAVIGWAAALESQKISDRTKAGLEAARVAGKTLGRPRLTPEGSRSTRHREKKKREEAAKKKEEGDE